MYTGIKRVSKDLTAFSLPSGVKEDTVATDPSPTLVRALTRAGAFLSGSVRTCPMAGEIIMFAFSYEFLPSMQLTACCTDGVMRFSQRSWSARRVRTAGSYATESHILVLISSRCELATGATVAKTGGDMEACGKNIQRKECTCTINNENRKLPTIY